jgi:hypothetical protein
LPEALPPAEGASRLVLKWRGAWPSEPPWLICAPEARLAAWTEALRASLAVEAPVPFPAAALRAAVRAAADLGGALILGGLPADETPGAMRPALFVNLPPSRALLRAWSEPAPVIGLAAREPNAADLAVLAPDLAILRDFLD